jgi:colanic acid biosynthesis glycosyl transferase WcaI
MRCIFVNQFGWADSAPTSLLLTDVCRQLTEEGHEVHVVCGRATYVLEKAPTAPPFHLHRVPCMPFGRGPLRIASYASFFAAAAYRVMQLPKPDVLVTMTTPPLLSLLGTLFGRLRGDRHFMWEMDLFPEALADTGIIRANSRILRMLLGAANYARQQAEGIVVLGQCMERRLAAAGVARARIHVAENWGDSRVIQCLPFQRETPLKVLYSGNLGLTHDVDTLGSALVGLRNDSSLKFRFTGGGKRFDQLRAFAAMHSLAYVSFEPYCAREDLSEHLAWADVGLVTQLATCFGTVVPSKIYALMAAGRPIVFVGPRQSTAGKVITHYGCGWCVENGDRKMLVSLLRWLQENRPAVEAAGRRGHKAFLEHYDMPTGVARVAVALGVLTRDQEPSLMHASHVG